MKKREVEAAISYITHPAIDATLIELGIISELEVTDEQVRVEFAFPFAKILIKQNIIGSVQIVSESLGFKFIYQDRLMTPNEKTVFLNIEHARWKDGTKPMCS